MFGVGPSRTIQEARAPRPVVYTTSLTGALLLALGLVSLIIAAGLTLSATESLVSYLLMAVPLTGGGAIGLAHGYANLHTRVDLGPDGLRIVAPGWRGCPCPPLQQLSARWPEVRAVRHRTELYDFGLPWLRLPVEVYAIETAGARVVLASYFLPQLEPVLIEIANRARCRWREDDPVELGAVHAVLCGTPGWET